MIEEMWRLPDVQFTGMDGKPTRPYPRVAIRQDNWIGWYRVLGGGDINTIPDGSVPLILEGEWVNAPGIPEQP